jgi:hypothetical protein
VEVESQVTTFKRGSAVDIEVFIRNYDVGLNDSVMHFKV